mmetsp:Transcript_12338/g.14594  ORF Transcript_12338/g.14594 Transcript_12338/m.14594 type:complete len:148 (-) Transcript_12338:97-540(-)
MADEQEPLDVDAGEEVEMEVEESKGPMDPMEALMICLQKSMHHEGLARGLREVVKALDKEVAQICVLSKGCDEPGYTTLVQSLCKKNQIPLINVPDSKTLGEWCGLCKLDEEGNTKNVVNCSSAAIISWGEDSGAKSVLMKHIASQN